ncbi:hypothetical protein O6H91_10G079300 [Diphasiastrum complanatum]|uniref:Uncharacterized protein n=1 Tax=Diphasiastrum complanatum TaxID=34168 RepID=A0ACC2CIN1_DIPCM|nr:hypothetical protein O6H91_10G079300 [Diphasiastrum complanatum]
MSKIFQLLLKFYSCWKSNLDVPLVIWVLFSKFGVVCFGLASQKFSLEREDTNPTKFNFGFWLISSSGVLPISVSMDVLNVGRCVLSTILFQAIVCSILTEVVSPSYGFNYKLAKKFKIVSGYACNFLKFIILVNVIH